MSRLNNPWIKGLVFIILITIITAVSFKLGILYNQNKKNLTSEKHQAGYRYISPLLECDNNYTLSYNYNLLKNNLEDIANEKLKNKNISNISLYFRDLNNGPWISINGEEKFSPSSLLKVPLMIAYLKIAEDDPAILEKEITIIEEHISSITQNILPLERVAVGEKYKVDELIERMIKYSDNNAANALLYNISMNELNIIYNDFGIKVPGNDNVENFMTVTEYTSFFRILYNASYLNREMSEKALALMAETSFLKGLNSKLPPEITVAHKFGERIINNQKQLHDCGIVYNKGYNYLLCIMTRGSDFSIMEEAIADISKEAFLKMKMFTEE